MGRSEESGEDVRYDFIVQSGEEEYRYFCYGREVRVGGPDLVAEKCEVFRWWDDTAIINMV